jgi:hypothetical protein
VSWSPLVSANSCSLSPAVLSLEIRPLIVRCPRESVADEVIEYADLLRCMSPVVARNGHAGAANRCPLSVGILLQKSKIEQR